MQGSELGAGEAATRTTPFLPSKSFGLLRGDSEVELYDLHATAARLE